jgi:hypothetical protein
MTHLIHRRRTRRLALEQMDMAGFEAARAAIGRAVLRSEQPAR